MQHIEGERTYHVFYQLCAGADAELAESLNLQRVEDFDYTSQGQAPRIKGTDDAADFRELSNEPHPYAPHGS